MNDKAISTKTVSEILRRQGLNILNIGDFSYMVVNTKFGPTIKYKNNRDTLHNYYYLLPNTKFYFFGQLHETKDVSGSVNPAREALKIYVAKNYPTLFLEEML